MDRRFSASSSHKPYSRSSQNLKFKTILGEISRARFYFDHTTQVVGTNSEFATVRFLPCSFESSARPQVALVHASPTRTAQNICFLTVRLFYIEGLWSIFQTGIYALATTPPLRRLSPLHTMLNYCLIGFYRATLCVSAVFAVARCPSVCPSVCCVGTLYPHRWRYRQTSFSSRWRHHSSFFLYLQRRYPIPRSTPSMGE